MRTFSTFLYANLDKCDGDDGALVAVVVSIYTFKFLPFSVGGLPRGFMAVSIAQNWSASSNPLSLFLREGGHYSSQNPNLRTMNSDNVGRNGNRNIGSYTINRYHKFNPAICQFATLFFVQIVLHQLCMKSCGKITHPCPYFNGGLDNPSSLMSRHAYIITSHKKHEC